MAPPKDQRPQARKPRGLADLTADEIKGAEAIIAKIRAVYEHYGFDPVETPLLMDWLVKDEAAKQLRLARNPTGRFGKPEEIVHMAVYLASDESRWTNGASLVVDGGITVNYF